MYSFENKKFISILGLILIISSLMIVNLFNLLSLNQAMNQGDTFTTLKDDSQPITFETVYASDQSSSRIFEKIEQTITSQDQWEKFWQKMHPSSDPVPIMPLIEFNSYFLIATSMGVQPSGSHFISITGLKIIENNLMISITETFPGENCTVTYAMTHPLEIVKIEQVNFNEINFERISVIKHCNDYSDYEVIYYWNETISFL